jgi:metallo-beta-lactamase class B
MRGSSCLHAARCTLHALAFALAPVARAQDPSWLAPFPAFRIADNLYYVGTRGLASYLVTSPAGHILINSNLEATVPLLEASVKSLGFDLRDIKILLISHAHFDHNAASATIARMTGGGAKYMVMDGDVSVVETGGKTDFQYGDSLKSDYPPAHVDRVLHDGDTVAIGENILIARRTPGHTRGCTTWTMRARSAGKVYGVVIVGSPNVNPGYVLVNNRTYPEIATDYERSFRALRSLPADVFLGAHGSYFDLERKYERWKSGDPTAFVDPAGYRAFLDDRERAFRAELARQLR